jgi:hypothetical protein
MYILDDSIEGEILEKLIDEIEPQEKAILELADAINKACEKENQNDNLQ